MSYRKEFLQKSPEIQYQTYVFNLINYITNDKVPSYEAEIQLLIIQFFQMLSFTFTPIFISSWRDTKSFAVLSNILESFRLLSFFKGDSTLYLMFFYICVAYLIFYCVIIVYIAVALTKNLFIIFWPLRIVRFMTKLTTGFLFIPLLSTFMSVFNCPNNTNYYSPSNVCFSGIYILHTIFGSIMSLILIYIMFIYTFLAFDIKYNSCNFSAKHGAINDIFFLIEQIIFAILNEIIRSNSVLIICYFITSMTIAVLFYISNPYYSLISQRYHLLFHLLISWNMISVAIGQLLIDIEDFIPLLLFIFGCPVIILISLFHKKSIISVLNSKERNGFDYFMKGLLLLDYIETYHIYREKEIILDSYITFKETECFHDDCELKLHLSSQKADQNNKIHLILYLNSYFIEGLRKFPNYNILRIYYSIFLYHNLIKKHKARIELNNADQPNISYYDKYLIHKCRKEYDPSADNINFADVSNNLIYLTNFTKFIEKLLKASQLYLDFWALLNLSTAENKNNVGQLSTIGYSINTIIEEIHFHFDKMQEINSNDKVVLKYYSDFLVNLLNDHKNAKTYLRKLNEIEKETETIIKEDIVNLELNLLSRSDCIQYVVVSMENKKEPLLKEASLGLCESLGYSKKELVGHSLNMIMPDMFRENHDKLLRSRYSEFKKNAINAHISRKQLKSTETVLLTKSKYIIPSFISPGLIPNEFDDFYFIAKINIDPFSRQDQCCVLTDPNNIIWNFSSSAISLLNLNSFDMKNSEVCILDCMIEANSKDNKSISETKSYLSWKKPNGSPERQKEVHWYKNTKTKKVTTSFRKQASINISNHLKEKLPIFKLRTLDLSINNLKLGVLFEFQLKQSKHLENMPLLGSYIENISIGKLNDCEKDNKVVCNSTNFHRDFIPNNKDIFVFNMQQEKYSMTKENDPNMLEMVNKIKNVAINSINKPSEETESSNQSYTDSNSNSSSNDGNTPSMNEESNSKSSVDPQKEDITSTHNDYLDYYRVKFENIKYSIYNYEKKQYDIQTDFVMESQVTTRINEYNSQNKEPLVKSSKTRKDKNIMVNQIHETGQLTKSERLIQQLSYSLNKYETHDEISFLKLISLIALCIAIAEGIGCLFFFKFVLYETSEIDKLISISYDLLIDIIVSIFLVREISLLRDENYTLYYIDRDKHREELVVDMYKYFFKQEDMLNQIMSSQLYFSEQTFQKLYNTTMMLYMIKDDLNYDTYNITLFAGIFDTLDSLYHIASMPTEEIIPSENNIYSFVINGLNGLNLGLKNQAVVFHEEMLIIHNKNKISSYLILAFAILLSVVLYFVVSIIYFHVSEKKNDYLNIFFEISNEIIKISLIRCEVFNTKLVSKINSSNNNMALINNDDDYDNEDEALNDNNTGFAFLAGNHSKKKQQTIGKCPREKVMVKLFLIIFFGLINLMLIILIVICHNFLDSVYYSMFVYKSEIILQARYLNIFNIFREYMFDKNINTFYEPLEEEIENIFYTIYDYLADRSITKKKYEKYCSVDYLILSHELDNTDLCVYAQKSFPPSISDVYSCDKITFNTANMGLSILLTFYMEEVKELKNTFKVREAEATLRNYKYNYTLLGLPAYDELFPKDELQSLKYHNYHPVKLFTNEKHDELLILFLYVLLPIMSIKNEAMGLGITFRKNNFIMSTYTLIITYSVIILLSYFLTWRKLLNNLNSTIHKTKNMLNIIPMEVLIHLKSVHKLFKLNTQNDLLN